VGCGGVGVGACVLLTVSEQLAFCYRGTGGAYSILSHEACTGATLTDSVSAPRPRQAPLSIHLEINRDIHRGKKGTRACGCID
jgi:hypothetical protein